MNIGDDLHLLSLRCCCLWNVCEVEFASVAVVFFWSKVIVLANY